MDTIPFSPWFALRVLSLSAFLTSLSPRLHADEKGVYGDLVLPFFEKHCSECHLGEKNEGNFRLDKSIPFDFKDAAVRRSWAEVVNVLNSHSMPPEEKPKPEIEKVAAVVDWITEQISQAELQLRENAVVMRRLNRNEYKNTIRDLVGIDFDISGFPQDPPANGFDNVGSALSLSPMQLELYLDAARQIMDLAVVDGPKPESIRWRFEIDSGDSDSNRVKLEDGQRPIVNGGANPVEDGFKRVHHNSWDRVLNVRDFALKHPGQYVVRIRAAGSRPNREQVVASAKSFLDKRFDEQMEKNPKGERWHRSSRDNDLIHFETDRRYDYGPVRMKLVQDLGGQPKPISEMDVPTSKDSPHVFEIPVTFTTQRAGLSIEYAYSIPRALENFWFQTNDRFERPELFVDWIEIEGPNYPNWPPASHTMLLSEAITEANEATLIESTIGRFVRRAFRRPVSRAEAAPYVAIYRKARGQGLTTIEAAKSAFAAVLISPHFLYLVEDVGNSKSSITNHQLANRLSYFLWSSMPDQELLKVADAGKLDDAKQLVDQTKRMLNDPKSEQFVQNFADQWLGLRDVGANPPAMELYPHYDRHLEVSMVEEGRALFRTILREGRNVLDFIDPERLEEWIDRPKPKVEPGKLQLGMLPNNAHDRPMWLDVMLELSYLAFITDSTRVITFEWSREADGYGGGGENHHELSHHGGDAGMLEKLAAIDRFHLSRLKRFMEFLKETREGQGSMLDQTAIVFGSGMNSGAGGDHSPKNLPLIVAGGRGLGLKHDKHLKFNENQHPPLANVLLQVIQSTGVERESFSDATGTLSELTRVAG
ncbi:MAG: DUF1592 domain-containing protein [Planctomycetota bacterium]|nr:DUF1592 domain-containing protein [Planctomycetota bacterium]